MKSVIDGRSVSYLPYLKMFISNSFIYAICNCFLNSIIIWVVMCVHVVNLWTYSPSCVKVRIHMKLCSSNIHWFNFLVTIKKFNSNVCSFFLRWIQTTDSSYQQWASFSPVHINWQKFVLSGQTIIGDSYISVCCLSVLCHNSLRHLWRHFRKVKQAIEWLL